jgi:hypothetical protein
MRGDLKHHHANINVMPAIVVPTGDFWICPAVGPNAGVSSKAGPAPDQAYVFTDGVKYISPGACVIPVGTGTLGTAYATLRTATNVTVGQLTVGASGNGTFLLTCDITSQLQIAQDDLRPRDKLFYQLILAHRLQVLLQRK